MRQQQQQYDPFIHYAGWHRNHTTPGWFGPEPTDQIVVSSPTPQFEITAGRKWSEQHDRGQYVVENHEQGMTALAELTRIAVADHLDVMPELKPLALRDIRDWPMCWKPWGNVMTPFYFLGCHHYRTPIVRTVYFEHEPSITDMRRGVGTYTLEVAQHGDRLYTVITWASMYRYKDASVRVDGDNVATLRSGIDIAIALAQNWLSGWLQTPVVFSGWEHV